MRIFWQSFVDASVNAPYMALLSEYLNNIAAPGATVHVEGISPPDREFGRLAEPRCAVQAIDNGAEPRAELQARQRLGPQRFPRAARPQQPLGPGSDQFPESET